MAHLDTVAGQADPLSGPVRDHRGVMRLFPTGVCVVTTYSNHGHGRRHDAVTINSLSSVSLDPPLVSLSLRSDSGFLEDLLESGVWAVSILDADGEPLARSFARRREERTLSAAGQHAAPGTHTGALLYTGVGWLECRYRTHLAAGDHTVVLGEVLAHGHDDERLPLIFLHGRYHVVNGACHE